MPKQCPLSFLEEQLESGEALRVEGTEQALPIKASEAAIRSRDIAFSKIEPLISARDIFEPSCRNHLIKARAKELECSPQTLLRLLRLYWAGGQTRNALMPNYHRRGSTGGSTSKRGRPPKYLDRPIFQVEAEDLELFKRVIESKYLQGKTATLSGTFKALLREHYSTVDSEGVVRPRAEGEHPTLDQFRRVFKQHYPEETVIRQRQGDAEFELNHRPKLGRTALAVTTVGDSYEIDATIADVFLVSSTDRSVIVGKPTLYLIVDTKSWLIVGFYAGFEHPSWPAALHAVVSIAECKQALCARYAIPYRAEDWPADGVLPKEFVADRGELFSLDSARLADGLEVTIKNLPSKMANRKPHVECGFKLIQRPMAEHIPGYEPPENFRKRQGKHYDKDACLTLDEFTKIVLLSIIRHNRTPRANYPLSPSQTLGGLLPTPSNLWKHEIRSRAGALRRYSADYVRLALLPRAKASVSREGIAFGGCHYSCNEAIQRGWFTRTAKGTLHVEVSYDRRLVDAIYIHDDQSPGKVITATLLEKSVAFKGMSYQEVESVVHHRTRLRHEGQRLAMKNDFEFHATVDPITLEARTKTQFVTKGKSRSSRKADTREARHIERALERQEKAAPPSKHKPVQSAEILTIPREQAPSTRQNNAKLLDMLNGK